MNGEVWAIMNIFLLIADEDNDEKKKRRRRRRVPAPATCQLRVRSLYCTPGCYKEMSSLSLLTNSALVYEPKRGGRGRVAGSQPMCIVVNKSPNKLWRSNSILTYVVHSTKVEMSAI